MSMDDLYNNLKVYEPEVKGMFSSSSSTQNMAFVSSSNNNTKSSIEAVNAAYGVTTASTQVNTAYSKNINNLSDAVICSFFDRINTPAPKTPCPQGVALECLLFLMLFGVIAALIDVNVV
ncbi:hypothetical protein Tco_0093210 [Tanacetum coccineum]